MTQKNVSTSGKCKIIRRYSFKQHWKSWGGGGNGGKEDTKELITIFKLAQIIMSRIFIRLIHSIEI